MGFCFTCGWYEPGLDPRTAMCRWCRDHWQPPQPQPTEETP